jgi:hypothetical protein
LKDGPVYDWRRIARKRKDLQAASHGIAPRSLSPFLRRTALCPIRSQNPETFPLAGVESRGSRDRHLCLANLREKLKSDESCTGDWKLETSNWTSTLRSRVSNFQWRIRPISVSLQVNQVNRHHGDSLLSHRGRGPEFFREAVRFVALLLTLLCCRALQAELSSPAGRRR